MKFKKILFGAIGLLAVGAVGYAIYEDYKLNKEIGKIDKEDLDENIFEDDDDEEIFVDDLDNEFEDEDMD